MTVLLAFVGADDPYQRGGLAGEECLGPAVRAAVESEAPTVVLATLPEYREQATATAAAITARRPFVEVHQIPFAAAANADYAALADALHALHRRLRDDFDEWEPEVLVESAPPRLQACWLLLLASGELRAPMVRLRPDSLRADDGPALIREAPPPCEPGNYLAEEAKPFASHVAGRLGLLAEGPAMRELLDQAAMLADSPYAVLITGESGTGKELLANYIHQLSPRRGRRLVAVNCAALPRELVDSMLFGHEKGAFTGANRAHQGYFAQADGGTIFLDEVGELPGEMQAKFLRVLQDGSLQPIGATSPRRVDVRVIAATNRDLRAAVRAGDFRDDLYFRLHVGHVQLPPLRERREEIRRLALRLLDRVNDSLRQPKRIDVAALDKLAAYHWPGNVRELKACLERSCIMTRGAVLGAEHILLEPGPEAPEMLLPEPHEGFDLQRFLAQTRIALLERALELTAGNASRAARLLGLSPQAVHNYLRKTGRAGSGA